MSDMTVETSRLVLRRMVSSDAAELYQATGDPEVMRYWNSGGDKNIEHAKQRIERINNHWAEHGFGDWGIVEKESGRLIGFSGLHYVADMDEVNIGYAFEKSKWQQGLGFETGQAILDFGFQILSLSEVVATIMPDNITSIKLAEKFGMIFWKRFTWGGTPHVAYSMTRENWGHFQKKA